MDDADRAQEYNEVFHQAAMINRRKTSGVSATHCTECEEIIPEARRLAVPGCQTCINCQRVLERN